jgi:hypothetical protein
MIVASLYGTGRRVVCRASRKENQAQEYVVDLESVSKSVVARRTGV